MSNDSVFRVYHRYGKQVVAYHKIIGYYWSDFLPHPTPMISDVVNFHSKKEALEVVSKMPKALDSYGCPIDTREHIYMKIPKSWIK